ncbi:MAG: NEW3 domain-containing protein [Candidatus Limnocylindria bacterium]
MSHRFRPRRSAASLIAPVIALLIAAVATPVAAQSELTLTTPFPGVSVQPGATASFPVTVGAAEPTRADLSVEDVPNGWTASLHGGGYEVQSVLVDPDDPPAVSLDVTVPDDAAEGDATITMVATGGDDSAELAVTLHVAAQAGGSVGMEADFPTLQGTVDQSFEFSLQLSNDTPQPLTFSLQAAGPSGWQVSARPSSEETAASVTVEAGAQERLTATAQPPPDAPTGEYPIQVVAVSGDHTATADLSVQVTGRVEMQLTTAGQRLNTTANAGAPREMGVVVVNNGTSPLTSVQLSGSGPTDWEVAFAVPTIEQIAPGATGTATATITPSANAIAGDYVVTLNATTEGANESVELRVTVETSPVWGIIGLLLIVAAVGGLVWVFRRYGRR